MASVSKGEAHASRHRLRRLLSMRACMVLPRIRACAGMTPVASPTRKQIPSYRRKPVSRTACSVPVALDSGLRRNDESGVSLFPQNPRAPDLAYPAATSFF